MTDFDKKNRVKKEVSVFKKPAIFVPENRGMSDCCVPFLTLVDETDLSSHRNDENSAWSLGETVTFELRKNGVVTNYVPVSIPFPNEPNAWYTTIPWRDVFLMDGYGVYELYMTVDFAGITQTKLWSKYDVQPYQNTAGKYLGKGTVRLKSVFNDVNTLEGIDFTGAYVVDTLRLKAKFGYWNPLTDVDNVQYTDAEKMKVRREDLTEYELRVDLHGECIIDRLRFHLVAENACYITDHNADNYTYKYLDYPVIVKSGFEPTWIDGTRKVKGVAKFEDKQKMTKTHFQDNDTNGKFDPPKNATLPAKIIDSGIEVQVPSGQTYECSTVVNEKYIELMKDTFKGRSVIDSATFEAESCLVNELTDIGVNLLDTASLIITPNSQKAGILKAVKPFDNTGDLSVTRATSATRVNSSGLIESVASNVPRLDYTNGSCPSILVEPQRTNVLTYSEDFTNISWVKVDATITSNAINSPNGTITADKIVESTSNSAHFTVKSFFYTGSNTLSVFLKKGERDKIIIQLANSSSIYYAKLVDLTNGTLLTPPSPFTNIANSNIKDFGNGWFRVDITLNDIILEAAFFLYNGSSYSYTGDGTSGAYIWGAQLEAGSYATSYIPTTSASVTRNADVISKTGITGITTITETFENGTTNVITGSPTSYTMSNGRIKHVIGL